MLEDVVDQVIRFRDERDWKQFHNPKDLAISISLEAAELLENFQWTGRDMDVPDKKDSVIEELADVLIYSIMMADILNVDINQIIREKLEKNEEKYQVEKAYGSKKKYIEFD
ncbi:MAG: nucleotide pyrophosphohydrolase [Bacillota bacterium]|nr:nucleotide pyrophosphohydrolase [Bacillota bacterium]